MCYENPRVIYNAEPLQEALSSSFISYELDLTESNKCVVMRLREKYVNSDGKRGSKLYRPTPFQNVGQLWQVSETVKTLNEWKIGDPFLNANMPLSVK